MLSIYRFLINILFPIIIIVIFLRKFFNKEDKLRFKEKIFISSFNIQKNKKKKLIWFHAASIGEFKSIIPLIEKLNKNNNFNFLITTVTLSSSQLIKKEFFNKKNILHRFFPIDKPKIVNKFIDGWSPDLAIFVDSEIWPNFILEIKNKKIPLILLNARITKKTFSRWIAIPKVSNIIFQAFDLCLSSSEESKKYLEQLNAKNIKYLGNLKLTYENKKNNLSMENKNILKKKKYWCAVSTHEEEDLFCLRTHLNVKKKYEDLITIIIPRHINRVRNIKLSCEKLKLRAQILSEDESINTNNEIIIINSYGITSDYLAFCKSVFIGKSMIKKLEHVGGQSPIEAAKLGCKIYHGPYVYNFQEIYDFLHKHGISEKILELNEFSNKLNLDFSTHNEIKEEKLKIINDLGKKILNDTCEELDKIIN